MERGFCLHSANPQLINKLFCPLLYIRFSDNGLHSFHTGFLFFNRHVQGCFDSLRYFIDIIWVDDNALPELLGSARKFAEN